MLRRRAEQACDPIQNVAGHTKYCTQTDIQTNPSCDQTLGALLDPDTGS